jgi:multidrug efflux system membrane fusion protein
MPGSAGRVAVSVAAATVERRDVAIELKGIGTVQAYNTVNVKPRVSGQIVEIAFTEGQRVQAGTVLAKIDPRPFAAQLHQAQAAKAKDEAQLASAEADLARISTLAPKGYATTQSLDAQKAVVGGLRAALLGDQATIENAQLQLDWTEVTAPISGVTGIRLIDVGNMITPSDPGVVVITQTEPISVVFTLPADAVTSMGVGAPKDQVRVSAYGRDDVTKLADGTLALIDNEIDPATNTVRLKANFANTGGALKPGAFVNAHLLLRVLPNAVTVPAMAIKEDDKGAFTYVIGQDDTVAPRRVVLGPTSDGRAVVESGLSPGERVVTEGQYGLKPGARVAIRPPTAKGEAETGGGLSIP